MKYKKIPNKYTVGGQDMTVSFEDFLSDDGEPNGDLGSCWISQGEIKIRKNQTESSKHNTFYHELTHSILGTMKHSLNNDEGFVSCFAGFLTEAMKDAYFKVAEDK